MQSEQIDKLAAAMVKVQTVLTGAVKDSANPFFKSKYADLNSCWDACRKPLTDNGLAVIQTADVVDGTPVLVTTLLHSSGQWISGRLPIRAKDDGPQAQGSGITYARRYALAAIIGLVQVDDDAEAAQGRDKADDSHRVDTKIVNQYSERLKDAINKSNDTLLREVMDEVKEAGNDFRIAVWATLPKSVQDYIRDKAPKAA